MPTRGEATPAPPSAATSLGTSCAVGTNVPAPKIGDHVAGFVMGPTFADNGAYAEYVKTPAELAWAVPAGTFTHEEAATLGCAYVVSFQLQSTYIHRV